MDLSVYSCTHNQVTNFFLFKDMIRLISQIFGEVAKSLANVLSTFFPILVVQ